MFLLEIYFLNKNVKIDININLLVELKLNIYKF